MATKKNQRDAGAPLNSFLTGVPFNYSVLKLLTGFVSAAFIAW